jgi:ferredoxin
MNVSLTINGKTVTVPDHYTLLEASEKLGIEIPTLCHSPGHEPFTSCMICMVHDLDRDILVPACSATVQPGLNIATDDDKVHDSRKDTLDLLLSEHVGDCEAPCHRICPALMNIPLMIRQIRAEKFHDALVTVKHDIALPAVLGRICPAPCEKGCTRNQHDGAVSICLLKRFVADWDLSRDEPYLPAQNPSTGKRVAIVGAGPAGLSAAYYLAQMGHQAILFDDHPKAGGMLRYGVPEEQLPRDVLDAEIEQIFRLGVAFQSNTPLKDKVNLQTWLKEYDAVILAMGAKESEWLSGLGLQASNRGLVIDRDTHTTSMDRVFAGGGLVSSSKMAVRAAGHGKTMALAADQFLQRKSLRGRTLRFNSVMGRLQPGEAHEFEHEAALHPRVEPSKAGMGLTDHQPIKEAERCFHCDCRKPESCKLRLYADRYKSSQKRFRTGKRPEFERMVQQDIVVYETGKCIKCGLCVSITKLRGEKFGLTFVDRGFDVRVRVPFNETLKDALTHAARECIESCPTGALSWMNNEEHLE